MCRDGVVGPGSCGRRDAIQGETASGSQAGSYQRIIEARREEFSLFSLKRLYEEVRAAAYTGGCFCVTDYVRSVRWRDAVQTVVRFETPPWWHYPEHRVLVSRR